MKVEFLVENIENLLPILIRFIPTHSQIPALSNILIEAKKEGLFIYATNLETGIIIKVPAKIDENGATTVPGRQFIEIVNAFPKDKVEVSLEKDKLQLRCRENKATLQTISREEFPNILEEKGEKVHEFQYNELDKIFSKLTFSVSQDDSRPELTGILFSQKRKYLDFVSTDGFRLSLRRVKGSSMLEENGKMIFPAKIILEALSLKTKKSIFMYVQKKTNQVVFEVENVIFVGRLISGEFPNYERVIPQDPKTKILVDTEEFLQKLRLFLVFARESANIIRIEVKNGAIKMFAQSSGLGEGEATIEGKQEGADTEIAFNIKFLTDIMKNIAGKNTSIELSSSVDPAVFKTEEDPDFLHVIMPVRLQD